MEKEIEIWKPIKGYEGFYEVSNLGRVRSLDRVIEYSNGRRIFTKGKILKPILNYHGYLTVNLKRNSTIKVCQIHRLVMLNFVENTFNLPMINHKDECKTNNHISNLEYCDCKYNSNYGSRNKKLSEIMRKIGIAKKVLKISTDGEILKKYNSLSDVSLDGYDSQTVGDCCRFRTKSHKGYLWCYEENKINIPKILISYHKSKQKIGKPILMFDLNGSFIKRYERIIDLEKEFKVSRSNVRKCCLGKQKSHNGYIFKYAE